MKRGILYVIFLLVFKLSFSQGWVEVNHSSPNFSFQMPDNPVYKDTVRVKYYYYQLDTVIGFQVHINDSAIFNSDNNIFNEALLIENGDTLRAIARIMITFSNAELTSINSITGMPNYSAIEIGMKYNILLQDERVAYSFIRIYRNNMNFISFSVSGYEDDLERLIINKETYFNSIDF